MINPTGRRLLVEAVDPKKDVKTQGGILLSAAWSAAPEAVQGKVLAVGPDCLNTEVDDVVLVPQFAPTKVQELPTDKTFIIPEEDVIATITNK